MSIFRVKNCFDCPFLSKERDMMAVHDVCDHPKAPSGYGSIIDSKEKPYPKWCPLNKSHLIIQKLTRIKKNETK